MYFNNSNDYLIATLFINTCLLGLGINCGVYFVQESINNQASLRRKGLKNSQACKPTPVCNATNNGVW
jgi:hypothetical protein